MGDEGANFPYWAKYSNGCSLGSISAIGAELQCVQCGNLAETASNRTRMEADILTFHHHEGAYCRAIAAEHGFLAATEQSVIGFGNRDGTDRGPAEQGWGV